MYVQKYARQKIKFKQIDGEENREREINLIIIILERVGTGKMNEYR